VSVRSTSSRASLAMSTEHRWCHIRLNCVSVLDILGDAIPSAASERRSGAWSFGIWEGTSLDSGHWGTSCNEASRRLRSCHGLCCRVLGLYCGQIGRDVGQERLLKVVRINLAGRMVQCVPVLKNSNEGPYFSNFDTPSHQRFSHLQSDSATWVMNAKVRYFELNGR